MDILRIATAGSVDDGKSTLIGRLLYETNSITQDKLDAILQASKRRGIDYPDLSLLTDGLIAEREQGITIDVAHIYFSTPKRKYIIADTPGHLEYTRNMITGASTAHVAIILIDARNGIVEQTYRHYYITQLLCIPYVIVCINKMDLVGYAQETFTRIQQEFATLLAGSAFVAQHVSYIPIASLYGDMIASHSTSMPWYSGPHLLQKLEEIDYHSEENALPVRFPIQHVIRPKSEQYHDFRGFAGRLTSGILRKGDRIVALPTLQHSSVSAIYGAGGEELAAAETGNSIVVTLSDEIDSSRGGMLVHEHDQLTATKEINAQVCWLDHQPLRAGRGFLLQHGVNRTKAKILTLNELVDVKTHTRIAAGDSLQLNEIGTITLRTAQPVFTDRYVTNKHNGAFILIDEQSHGTVGVGFVE